MQTITLPDGIEFNTAAGTFQSQHEAARAEHVMKELGFYAVERDYNPDKIAYYFERV